MKKVGFLLLACMLTFVLVLSGCSGSSSQNAEPTAATPEPTKAAVDATKQPESTPVTNSLKKYKGQIVVSLNKKPEDVEGFNALAAAYNKLQPDVKLVWEPNGGGAGDYPTWLGTQLAAGNPRPDIVAGNYVPTYDKYVDMNKYRYTTNQYTGNKWDQDLDFNFFNGQNGKGQRIMVPTQAVHIMWFYNKDIFDKVGVKPPTNWDELISVSDKLQQAGYIPIASNYIWKVPQWVIEIYADQYMRGWQQFAMAQKGDYNYDDDKDGQVKFSLDDPYIENKYSVNMTRYYKALKEGQIRFDTPEMAAMVRNMSKVFPKFAQQDFFVSQDDYPLFIQGKAAMIIDGTWSLPTLTNDMKNLNDPKRLEALKIDAETAKTLKPFNWGTFENPPMTDNLVSAKVRSVESATGEYLSVIDKGQEQTEMVLDFIKFWTSKPGYQAYVDGYEKDKAGGFSPGGPVMVKGVKLPDRLNTMMSSIKMMGNAENGLENPLSLGGDPELRKQAFNLYKDALEGKTSPEDFGKKLQKLYMDNMDTILKKAGLTDDDLAHPERAPGSK